MESKIFTVQIEDYDNTSLEEMEDIIGNALSEKGINCNYYIYIEEEVNYEK